jgi:hypothetical protein
VAKHVLGDNSLSLLELAINEKSGMTADLVIGAQAAGQRLRAGLLRVQCAIAESNAGRSDQSKCECLTDE